MPLVETLSERLKEMRSKKGCSVAEFAEELGISRSSLQSLLNGKGNPRIDTIEHMAKQLGIDPLELLTSETDNSEMRKIRAFANILSNTAQLPTAQQKLLMRRLLEISGMIG